MDVSLHMPLPLAFFGSGWLEVMVIGLVVLLLFGNKLPGMARNLGRSFVEFKRGVKGEKPEHLPEDRAEGVEADAGKKEREAR